MLRLKVRDVVRLAVVLSGLLASSSARADLIVSIGSTSIAEGGSGFLDVLVNSTTGADLLNGFSAEFQITTASGRALWFTNPQSDSQVGVGNYVFAGDSAAQINALAIGSVGPNTTYIGLDATESGNDVSIPFTLSPSKLLARLDLTTLTAFSPLAGDVFTVSLVDGINTAFFNSVSIPPISYTSTSGTVTVTQAVPEPSSMILLSVGLGGVIVARYRKRRVQPAAQS